MLSEPVPFSQGLHGDADLRLPQARSRFDIPGRSLVLIPEKGYDAGQGSFHAQALDAFQAVAKTFAEGADNAKGSMGNAEQDVT
jgi:hypothetical protein